MGVEVYTEYESENYLKKYVPVAESHIAKNIEDIKFKAPIVLKILSDDLLHKTEVGGVKVVKENGNIRAEYNSLIEIAKKNRLKLEGILVQKYYSGLEILIGIKRDQIFGHIIVMGLGGIFSEVLMDTSSRKCPISLNDANEMINDLRAKEVLLGYRGKKYNLSLLKKILVKISEIPIRNKKIKELDINPFILKENGGCVVDARIIFEK